MAVLPRKGKGGLVVWVGVCWLLVLRGGAGGAAAAQACAEPHYRWSEKTDTLLATRAPVAADVSEILTRWSPLRLTSRDKCAPRVGREDSVFAVTGWVRRIRLHESDGDWHIEVTEAETSAVASCLIAEIPLATYGAVYRQARSALAALVDTTRLTLRGDLTPPVQVRLVGGAFFDGYHQRVPPSGGPARPSGHGRCNGSLRALWEVHPVYRVEPPPRP